MEWSSNLATKEREEKYEDGHEDHEGHIESYNQCKEEDYKYINDNILNSHFKEDLKEVVEPLCISNGSFNEEESRWKCPNNTILH